jgi:hypothetical protein
VTVAPAARTAKNLMIGVVVMAALAMAMASAGRSGLIGTGSASYCDPTASHAFAPWGDTAAYALAPGGSFESGVPAWSLSGGAKIVSGNEPFFLHGAKDKSSLLLPAGSSATSPTMCFALGDWHTRFLMKNVGSAGGSLRVSVVVPSLLGGLLTVLDGGTVTGSGTWQPSPRMGLLLSNVTSLIGTRAVAFRFTPVGRGAAYQIDDVYLDPWKCT